MSEVDQAWDGMIEKDEVKKALESNLVDAGRYRAIAEKYEPLPLDQQKEYFDKDEKNRNTFFGKPYGTFTLRLGSKRDGKGATAPFVTLPTPKVFFLKVSPATVMAGYDATKQAKETRHFNLLASIAGVSSKEEVKAWVLEHPFEINLSVYPSGDRDGRTWDAGNKVQSISVLKEGE